MTIPYFYTPVFRGYRNRTLAWRRFIYAVYLSAGRCFNIIFKIELLIWIVFDLILIYPGLTIYIFINLFHTGIAKRLQKCDGVKVEWWTKKILKMLQPWRRFTGHCTQKQVATEWIPIRSLPLPPLHLLSFNSLFGNAWAIVTTST